VKTRQRTWSGTGTTDAACFTSACWARPVGLADLVLTRVSPVEAQATTNAAFVDGPGVRTSSVAEGTKIGEIYQLQAAFHQAKSHQDIDLMMSLWATDATFTFGGDLFSGADAIRAFFLGSGSWAHPRIRSSLRLKIRSSSTAIKPSSISSATTSPSLTSPPRRQTARS
jgi:hypothetical protein